MGRAGFVLVLFAGLLRHGVDFLYHRWRQTFGSQWRDADRVGADMKDVEMRAEALRELDAGSEGGFERGRLVGKNENSLDHGIGLSLRET